MLMMVKQNDLHNHFVHHRMEGIQRTEMKRTFLIMARVIDRTYRARGSDCGNLGLSQRGFRPLSVNRLDRSGSLGSQSLADFLKTSVLPAFETGSTERM